MTKLYLQKNNKAVAEIKEKGDTRLPYFKLKVIPENEGDEWKEVCVLWRAKNGKGYNGKLADGVSIVFDQKTQPDANSGQPGGNNED